METKWHHLCWGLSYILHHSQQALIKVGFKHFAHLPNPHLKPPVLSLLVPGSVEKPITEPHNGVLDQTVGLGTKITKRWQSSREREKKITRTIEHVQMPTLQLQLPIAIPFMCFHLQPFKRYHLSCNGHLCQNIPCSNYTVGKNICVFFPW